MRNWMTMLLDLICFGLWSKRLPIDVNPARRAKQKPPEGLLSRIPGPAPAPAPKTTEEAILEESFYPFGRYGIAAGYFNAFCLPVREPPLTTVDGFKNLQWYRWYAAHHNTRNVDEILGAYTTAVKEQQEVLDEYLPFGKGEL